MVKCLINVTLLLLLFYDYSLSTNSVSGLSEGLEGDTEVECDRGWRPTPKQTTVRGEKGYGGRKPKGCRNIERPQPRLAVRRLFPERLGAVSPGYSLLYLGDALISPMNGG